MKLTVDRIEENIVVCENEERKMLEISIEKFLTLPKEGDIILENGEGMYDVLKEETKDREEEIKKRFLDLFKK